MLTREKLSELYRELRSEKVLSIYLDADAHDPAERKVWRRELDHALDGARARAEEEDEDDLDRFDEARSRLLERLEAYDGFIPGRGWVGFATADQVWYAESLPVPMPNLVRWEQGIRVAPYVRALKQSRVVVAVLLDSRQARIFTYEDGEVTEATDLHADTFLGDLTDVGVAKRASTSSGVRGKTGTDAAQTFLEVGTKRMRTRLVERLSEYLGDKGFLIIGGTPEAVSALAQEVPDHLGSRVAQRPSMHVDMAEAEVKEAMEETASALSRGLQSQLLDEVIDMARSNGKGVLGRDDTERALVESRVDTLLVARSFRQRNPDFADHCVGAAFEQSAGVEELSAEGAERLESEGDGLGARLRYTIRPSE